MLQLHAALIAISLFLWGVMSAAAEDQRPPSAESPDEYPFVQSYDAVCGLGQTLSEGCAAIRQRRTVDATSKPWGSIGRVNFASIRIRHHCTGTLVAEQIVLTAAHCLYNGPRKTWIPPESIIFVAGFQRGSWLAASRVERFVVSTVQDVTSREFRSAPDQDWALLVLKEPIGREVGFWDVHEPSLDDFNQSEFWLAGYSGLRPNVLSVASDCGNPRGEVSKILLQACSAMNGDSGAPIFVERDGEISVVGVFAGIVGSQEEFASLAVSSSTFMDVLENERGN